MLLHHLSNSNYKYLKDDTRSYRLAANFHLKRKANQPWKKQNPIVKERSNYVY